MGNVPVRPLLPPVAGATAPEGHAVIASAIPGNLSAFPYFVRDKIPGPVARLQTPFGTPLPPVADATAPEGHAVIFTGMALYMRYFAYI